LRDLARAVRVAEGELLGRILERLLERRTGDVRERPGTRRTRHAREGLDGDFGPEDLIGCAHRLLLDRVAVSLRPLQQGAGFVVVGDHDAVLPEARDHGLFGRTERRLEVASA